MSKSYRVVIVPDEEAIGEWVDREDAVIMDRMELIFTIGNKAGGNTVYPPFDPPKFTPEALAQDALSQLHLRRLMKVLSVEQLDQAALIGLRTGLEIEPLPEGTGE
jgi:hypothetical protein